MKAILNLELRDENSRAYCKLWTSIGNMVLDGLGDTFLGVPPPSSWVAEITGFDLKYKYCREFLKSKKDYAKANSVGSRGIMAEFILDSGKLYEVKDNKKRCFAVVDNEGNVINITETEVIECLKSRLASTCLTLPEKE